MTKRWIKWPGPGQIRGEGEWREISTLALGLADWKSINASGYLPTHEGDETPKEEDDFKSSPLYQYWRIAQR